MLVATVALAAAVSGAAIVGAVAWPPDLTDEQPIGLDVVGDWPVEHADGTLEVPHETVLQVTVAPSEEALQIATDDPDLGSISAPSSGAERTDESVLAPDVAADRTDDAVGRASRSGPFFVPAARQRRSIVGGDDDGFGASERP